MFNQHIQTKETEVCSQFDFYVCSKCEECLNCNSKVLECSYADAGVLSGCLLAMWFFFGPDMAWD